ncbi:hypothetical protein DFH11DRAFT_670599 [Phellopilus nigrolimitatus]|nr:hypothetical protein DFH11DRAFT_670599 [Phellopilus nigrolimitatus]
MRSLSFISALVLALISLSSVSATSIARHSKSDIKKYYTRTHSRGENYQFDPREWHSVNATDLGYKYDYSAPEKRSQKASSQTSLGGTIVHLINDIWNGLQGTGNAEPVKITWYTGHDLLNPSCWSKTDWAPTDNSFACALTLQGWASQPKCFKFLELCNGPKKCVFVRVVDSCAGCAPGSKHVDLTKAAFSGLANINEGVLNVQMRQATEPDDWFEDLWGPKV